MYESLLSKKKKRKFFFALEMNFLRREKVRRDPPKEEKNKILTPFIAHVCFEANVKEN